MESEQGWSICLNKIREGKRVYYRYEDKNFSIKNKVINETEALQLKEMVTILNRFIGIPQFEWMEELLVRLETTINQKFRLKPIIGFEQNPFLKGLDHFSELYNAIQYKRVLIVTYQSFKQPKPVKVCLHPYYLKQYNNRWFLFALNEDVGSISNLALDRIVEIKERKKIYVENDSINFEEYFDDIVGVTVIENLEPTKVILHISSELLPYIESKPIHGSQKIRERDKIGATIELSLQINYEFISVIISYGEEITVLEPEELKNIMKTKAENLIKNYI